MADQATKLLDFSKKLDINLLDDIVKCMYSGSGEQQKLAQEILTHLKGHPEAWTRVDTILEYSSNLETKYYALQILEQVIKTRWKVLPRNQCDGECLIELQIKLMKAFLCLNFFSETIKTICLYFYLSKFYIVIIFTYLSYLYFSLLNHIA